MPLSFYKIPIDEFSNIFDSGYDTISPQEVMR